MRRKTSPAVVGAATLLCLASITSFAGAGAAGAASSPPAAARTTLAGSAAPAAARAHPVSSVAASAAVDFELVLQVRNPAGAEALTKAVSDPGSASFHKYVTAAQWESEFSPTAASVATATAWLRSQGFAVKSVSKDRITISASGTAAQVEKAFGTSLGTYHVNGHNVRLASTALSIPSSLAGTVVGAMGVNQTVATAADTTGAPASSVPAAAGGTYPPAPPAFITSPPCGTSYSSSTAKVTPPFGQGYPTTVPNEVCGYTPPQYRSAYSVPSTTTGKGVTVAVVDAYDSATIASDATQYAAAKDPGHPFSSAHFSRTDVLPFNDESLCDASSWLDEQAIDVESVHATAPDATIEYFGAQNCENSLFDVEAAIIDNGLANVVTNSWGDDAGDLLDDIATRTAYDDEFMLADATGISILYSSGDNGDNFNLFGLSSADYPPSSPFVTAVGGTSLQIGANGVRTGELGWATERSFKCTANVENALPGCSAATVNTWLPATYDGGSGGYTSYNYTQPYYQAPVVPASLSTRNSPILGPIPMRVEPDISADADPSTGFLIGLHQTFPNGSDVFSYTRYGGTSLASPLLAGIVADADQASVASHGGMLGFLNPALYRLPFTSAWAIHDVLPGGKQAQLRTDHASTYIPGASGTLQSFRQLTYEGTISYCDGTGNCASRPNTLSTGTHYDSMTGLGSPGKNFITNLAKF